VTAVDASPKMLAGLRAKLAREATPLDVDVRGGDVDEIAPTLAGPYDGIISSFAALNTVNLAAFAPHAARLLRPGGRFVCHMLASGHGRSAWSRLTRAAPRGTRTVVVGSEPLIHLDVSPDDIYRRFFAADFEAKGSYALGLFVGGAAEARLPEVLLDLLGRVESIIGAMPALASRGRFFVLDLQRRPS
jgi:SAM-dependent methyltransferase